ncbi:MAG: hypothetical protein RR123_00670 [Clostridia bacterium]
MKKKIIALMVVIPLIFMFAIYSSSNIVGISVDIPAHSIKICSEAQNGVIQFNMAESNDVFITAEVLPVKAKNRGYSLKIDPLEGTTQCNLKIDEASGKLSAQSVGQAKVTAVSKDGNFTDSIIVHVSSSKALDFVPVLNGFDAKINEVSGQDFQYEVDLPSDVKACRLVCNALPNNIAQAEVELSSSNNNVVSINDVTGKICANLSGSAIITAKLKNGINGDIVKKIKFNITKIQTASNLAINGASLGKVFAQVGENQITCFVENLVDTNKIILSGGDIKDYRFEAVDGVLSQHKLIINLFDNHSDSINFSLKIEGQTTPLAVEIAFANYYFDVFNSYHTSTDNEVKQKLNTKIKYIAEENLHDSAVAFNWSVTNGNVLKIVPSGNSCVVEAVGIGSSQLTVEAMKNGILLSKITVEKSVSVVQPISSVLFGENAKTYGIANTLALGNYEVKNNSYVAVKPKLDLQLNTNNTFTNYTGGDIVFESSDTNIMKEYITLDGLKLDIKSCGVATLNAKWKYASYFNEDVSASIKINCVKDGVNVTNYDSLKMATEGGKAVVIQNDIMLGKQNATTDELLAMAKTMPTTYNWKYYQNNGQTRPNVKYLIEFKNNVYGNGNTINADYITQAKDNVGNPKLFNGPLNFVAISTAAVKAQDNIAFLVRTNDVLIDNVVLKGCNDESLYENGKLNLSCLNYVGTTLEIMSNATVLNSRISNGRNVARIFGGSTTNNTPIVANPKEVNVANEKITVKIESCIMSNAREFIVKIGANRAVLATGVCNENFKVATLNDVNGKPYNQFENHLQDKYFTENYLLTDVTLKNCALATSGLFAIGMETHFSGEMLGAKSAFSTWDSVASTSFATALRLEGDVKFYDWKTIENIDSSTLIETSGDVKDFLKLDIGQMLSKVYKTGGDSYKNLLDTYQNNNYIHGGIAVYGGGYNYANFDFTKFNGEKFNNYQINISILAEGITDQNDPLYSQGTMLPAAAGKQDFKFFMYGGNSQNNYQNQYEALSNGSAYSWIAPAKN